MGRQAGSVKRFLIPALVAVLACSDPLGDGNMCACPPEQEPFAEITGTVLEADSTPAAGIYLYFMVTPNQGSCGVPPLRGAHYLRPGAGTDSGGGFRESTWGWGESCVTLHVLTNTGADTVLIGAGAVTFPPRFTPDPPSFIINGTIPDGVVPWDPRIFEARGRETLP